LGACDEPGNANLPIGDMHDAIQENGVPEDAVAVIPNEVRNLSGCECKRKEEFLGTQRASE
jgi:hypothetical protein